MSMFRDPHMMLMGLIATSAPFYKMLALSNLVEYCQTTEGETIDKDTMYEILSQSLVFGGAVLIEDVGDLMARFDEQIRGMGDEEVD